MAPIGLPSWEGEQAGVGADIVERTHLHRAYDADAIERRFKIWKIKVRTVSVAAARVLQTILDQAHPGSRAGARGSRPARCALMPRLTP